MTERHRRGRKIAAVAVSCGVLLIAAGLWRYRTEIRIWYLLSRDFESLGRNEQGYPEYLHLRTNIVFVLLPGRGFTMGASDDEVALYVEQVKKSKPPENWITRAMKKKRNWFSRMMYPPVDQELRRYSKPAHAVTLSPFLIAKYEVSQTQWKSVMGENPSYHDPARFVGRPRNERGERPVESVSWADCRDFCDRTGLRIPTEAQWEYACRGGRSASTAQPVADAAWYEGNTDDVARGPHAVGLKRANGFGLHDMLGNVSEWCRDRMHADFYGMPEASGLDPECRIGDSPGARSVRGGSFGSPEHVLFPFSRDRISHQSAKNHDLGFRPVYLLVEPPS